MRKERRTGRQRKWMLYWHSLVSINDTFREIKSIFWASVPGPWRPHRSKWRAVLRRRLSLSRAAPSLIMAASPQKWALTEHRPPVVFRKALPRLRICKIMDSKIIYLGHVQQAARMVWEPVPSESDSAPQCLKNGSGEDADPPMARVAQWNSVNFVN